ncbi:TB2/DP1/HVA22-related protein, partial [Gigaspora rosea]
SNVVGYLYPAYASFKAIKANNTKRIMEWLIYWIVIALFSVIELPFYYETKMIFMIWLILPQFTHTSVICISNISQMSAQMS